MRVRSSATLVFTFNGEDFDLFDYARGVSSTCSCDDLQMLQAARDARTVDDLLGSVGLPDDVDARSLLDDLVERSLLTLTDGDEEAGDAFVDSWGWGLSSAILHQTTTDQVVRPLDDQVAYQAEKSRSHPSPPLVYEPKQEDARFLLPDVDTNAGLFAHLERRRTCRESAPAPVRLEALSDLLHAGFGVTGWTENSVQRLPLKYAPSGGARNPYDAYVIAHDVEGLDRGAYRYCGTEHSLSDVDMARELTFSEALGGQSWPDTASALIVLVANFPRPMWKYEGDDNAYRVMLIEAGHIAQNVMLMAGTHGLSACPSAALGHTAIAETLRLEKFDQSPIYALALKQLDDAA